MLHSGRPRTVRGSGCETPAANVAGVAGLEPPRNFAEAFSSPGVAMGRGGGDGGDSDGGDGGGGGGNLRSSPASPPAGAMQDLNGKEVGGGGWVVDDPMDAEDGDRVTTGFAAAGAAAAGTESSAAGTGLRDAGRTAPPAGGAAGDNSAGGDGAGGDGTGDEGAAGAAGDGAGRDRAGDNGAGGDSAGGGIRRAAASAPVPLRRSSRMGRGAGLLSSASRSIARSVTAVVGRCRLTLSNPRR